MATILAIDDDPDMLVLIDTTLRQAGYRVITMSEASAATNLAAENRVDAVLLDIQMPDLSGHEVLQMLRGQPATGGVPILCLSAFSDSTTRIRCLREGADDFLDKPFDPEELVLRIDRLLDQRPRSSPESAMPTPAELEESLADPQVVDNVFMGRYEVHEVIGKGAMGVVFRGWDPRLKRPIALKTLRLDQLTNDRARRRSISRLLEEAITVARFNDPNIVAVYDVADGPRSAFIAMELVEGPSLEQVLKRLGKLPADQVIPLAIGIASGLATAHQHRIVHRDVKPGNVLLGSDGSIKVTDFGVAFLVSSLASEEGKIFGTPGYLPPETLMSEGYSEAGDLFSLGVTLYQCLTGERAFRGANIHQRMLSTLNDEVIPPDALVAGIPPELDRLVLQLLEKQAKDRPASARELVAQLTAVGDPRQAWELPPKAHEVRSHEPLAGPQSVVLEPPELR